MEQYLGIVSSGLFAILLANVILLLAAMAMGLIILGAIKSGRYFVLKYREALQKPEHLVTQTPKAVIKLVSWLNNEKDKQPRKIKKVKNGKS